MKAGEWLYLCVAHGNAGAIDVELWVKRSQDFPKVICYSESRLLVFRTIRTLIPNLQPPLRVAMLALFFSFYLLPQSFASYTMRAHPFAEEVASYLDWSPTPNLGSMARAGGILKTSSDKTLGTSISACRRISTNNGDRFG